MLRKNLAAKKLKKLLVTRQKKAKSLAAKRSNLLKKTTSHPNFGWLFY